MVREALNKLNEKQMNYCTTMSVLIARDRESGAKEQYEKDGGKLRGFLECLCQMEVITGSELKSLYLWFYSENRGKTEKLKNVKVEWCREFIKAAFEKHDCKGIEVNCFWNMAERSGLWERGTYGTPMSEALAELTKVETVTGKDGKFAYNVFRLA